MPVLNEPQHTYQTSKVHIGSAAGKPLPHKFEKTYRNKLKAHFQSTATAVFLISTDFRILRRSIRIYKQFIDWSMAVPFQSVK